METRIAELREAQGMKRTELGTRETHKTRNHMDTRKGPSPAPKGKGGAVSCAPL